jgi:hypothetical protein
MTVDLRCRPRLERAQVAPAVEIGDSRLRSPMPIELADRRSATTICRRPLEITGGLFLD